MLLIVPTAATFLFAAWQRSGPDVDPGAAMTVAYSEGVGTNNTAALLKTNRPESIGSAPGVMTSATAVPQGPVPPFEVVAQRPNDRPGKVLTYYAVTEPVGTTSDTFKDRIKRILQELAANNGGPEFSAYIFDSTEAAQTDVSYRTNPDLFSQEMLDARDRFNEQHLVANYVGGASAASDKPAFVLFWFPESRGPQHASLVSAEVWKP